MGTRNADGHKSPKRVPFVIMSKVESKEKSESQEGWDVKFTQDTKSWGELDGGEKAKALTINSCKIGLILLSLYLFICSLSFLADGFRLVAGRQAGEIFQNSAIFNNPIAGKQAISLVMGANIGPSVTSTIVALA